MTTKTAALGICDQCGGEIPPHLGDYTSKGSPRLHCSRDCRNTANSRAGAEERGRQARLRVAHGQWVNPATINKPDPANISAGVSLARKAEVEAGTWRNPALDDEAREKLSRPRVHTDDPILHSAIEKLGRGLRVNRLTPDEQRAHRAWRRNQRRAWWQGKSEAEKEAQRRKWRELWRRRKTNPKTS